MVVRTRWIAVVFVVVQVLVPTLLLTVRFATQGWYPTDAEFFGWQMYSLVNADLLCELRDQC